MASVKELFEFVRTVLNLAEDGKKNREEIKEVRQELRELAERLLAIKFETQLAHEREKSEREKLMKDVELFFLRQQRLMVVDKVDEKQEPKRIGDGQ